MSHHWEKHYLMRYHTFSYAHSASTYFSNYQFNNNNAKILGIAPFASQSSLENSDISLKIIHQKGYKGKDLINENASLQHFIQEANQYQIIHFYSHAKGDENASIRLYDSVLTTSKIYQFKLHANLIVLGACETGIGSEVRGEGVMSLARSFAYSGVPSVITTLWSVDNTYIYDLMEIFYQNLAEGMSKDEALSEAKKTLLMDTKRKMIFLPFNIGSTILIGQNTAIIPQKSNKIYYFFAIFVIIIIFGFFLRKKLK
jgi:CHAT domain-containing protein